MTDQQTDLQPIVDHPFHPGWRDPEACAWEADPIRPARGEHAVSCGRPPGEHRYTRQLPIEIEIYKPNPRALEPGYEYLKGTIVVDYRRPVAEVLTELNQKLRLEGVVFDESSFSDVTWMYRPANLGRLSPPWPEYDRIIVFPVTGGSEGHYVHIEVQQRLEDVGPDQIWRKQGRCLGLCKTFGGWDYACTIAARAGRLLGV